MDVYEAVVKRRAIRRFKDKPVPYDVLEECVNAGRLAPSARNRQLCEYIIVDDAPLMSRVVGTIGLRGVPAKTKGGPLPGTAPKACIITLINCILEAESGLARIVTTYDVGMSAENMMLVALERGIGACPALRFEEGELRQVLNIPASYDIALLVVLGYPDESPVAEDSTGPVDFWEDSQGVRHVPKRKLADILHRNKFA